jgi:hypothetical protein
MNLINKLKLKILKIQWERYYSKYRLPEIRLSDLGVIANKYEPTFMESICIPPYLGDSHLNDYSVLFSLLDHIKPEIILEFGTAHGNTIANICSYHNSEVYTVNALPEQIEGRITTYTLTKNEIGCVYRKFGFSERVSQIYENTKNIDLNQYLDEKSVNFAIIDACHDSDFVVNDFLKVLPFMGNNSVVLLHDTHPSLSKHYIDSYIGCMYLRKLGFDILYIEESSWAVWFSNKGFIGKGLITKLRLFIINFVNRLIFGDIETEIKRIRKYAKGFFKEDKNTIN